MSVDMLLELLTYAGLLLATFSSAWGLLHETTRKDKSGRKRLTGAGRIALGLVVGGLLVSVTSRSVKSRVEKLQADQRVAEERLSALRLAASLQSLQSIRIRWVFDGLASDVVGELKKGFARVKRTIEDDSDHNYQYDLDRTIWFNSLKRSEVVYPWFFYLATGEWDSRPNVVVRLPLYESEAVVLPLGVLPAATTENYPEGLNFRTELLREAGAGIDDYGFIYADPAEFDDKFFGRRKRLPAVRSSVVLNGDCLRIEMWIDADSMQESLDKVSSQVAALAQFPQVINLVVLAKFHGLPWPADNFAGRQRNSEADVDEVQPPPFRSGSLELIPNGIEELRVSYVVQLEGRGSFKELAGQESSGKLYCSAASLRAVRVDPG